MASYQNFSDAGPAPVDSGDMGATGSVYAGAGYSTDYSAAAGGAPASDDGFRPGSPRMILRFAEVFLSMLAFAIMSSASNYGDLPQSENQVMINVFAFIYVIVMIVAEVARAQSRYYPNLDFWEFALDFMFAVLTWFGAMALAVKCNKSTNVGGESFKFCKLLQQDDSYDSNFYAKSNGSIAMACFLSFAFMASTFISYKRLSATRG